MSLMGLAGHAWAQAAGQVPRPARAAPSPMKLRLNMCLSLTVNKPTSIESGLGARRRGKAQVTAGQGRVAPTVGRQQVLLPLLGSVVDLFGVEHPPQGRFAGQQGLTVGRAGGQVLQFLGIGRQIKQLGGVVHIVTVFEAAVPQQGGATRAADGVVLRQHRAVGGGPLRQVGQRLPAGLR